MVHSVGEALSLSVPVAARSSFGVVPHSPRDPHPEGGAFAASREMRPPFRAHASRRRKRASSPRGPKPRPGLLHHGRRANHSHERACPLFQYGNILPLSRGSFRTIARVQLTWADCRKSMTTAGGGTMRLLGLLLLACFAVGLAACGSGGSSSRAVPQTPTCCGRSSVICVDSMRTAIA